MNKVERGTKRLLLRLTFIFAAWVMNERGNECRQTDYETRLSFIMSIPNRRKNLLHYFSSSAVPPREKSLKRETKTTKARVEL